MIALTWKLCAAAHRYAQAYLPTNVLVRRLRTPRNLKWATPTATMLIPSYLGAAWLMTTLLAYGGPGWLNLLVLLLVWNAVKFTAFGLVTSLMWSKGRTLS